MTILEYKRYKKKSLRGGKKTLFFGKMKKNRRAAPKERKPVRYILGGIVMIALVGLLGKVTHSFLTTSPMFSVREFKVVKDGGLKDFDFENMSSLKGKDSIFSLDLAKTALKIGKNPWVKDVTLRKVYPGKLLVIVKKRQPAGMINLDALYFVDESGKVFKKVSKYDTKVYPVMTGFSKKKLEKSAYRERLKKALELRSMLKESKFEGNISEINYHGKEGLSVVFKRSGLRVKLGYRELTASFARLDKHYDRIKGYKKKVGYVDLRYPGKIIVGQKKKI